MDVAVRTSDVAMIATSAVPFLAVAVVVVLVIALVQTRGFLAALARSDSGLDDVEEGGLKCGFRLSQPRLLSVSYPLGRLRSGVDGVWISSGVAKYRFDATSLRVEALHRTVLFHRFRMLAGDLVATVYVRDIDEARRLVSKAAAAAADTEDDGRQSGHHVD